MAFNNWKCEHGFIRDDSVTWCMGGWRSVKNVLSSSLEGYSDRNWKTDEIRRFSGNSIDKVSVYLGNEFCTFDLKLHIVKSQRSQGLNPPLREVCLQRSHTNRDIPLRMLSIQHFPPPIYHSLGTELQGIAPGMTRGARFLAGNLLTPSSATAPGSSLSSESSDDTSSLLGS